jgi:hypothetical protein
MKRLAFSLLLAVCVVFATGCNTKTFGTYSLDPVIINQAMDKISQQPGWCIGIASVDIGTYYPGNNVRGAVAVHNGNDGAGDFIVSSTCPYITIEEPQFSLDAMETKLIYIDYEIPKEITPSEKYYEFVIDINRQQEGNVLIAYQQKWTVNLR